MKNSDAKEIAFYYFDLTNTKPAKSTISRTIVQAKALLNNYTKEEIIKVIDYIIKIQKKKIYSLGYVNVAIENIIEKMNEEQVKEEIIKKTKQEIASIIEAKRGELKFDESTQRNKDKLNGFGVQSRFGKKFNFDMFERNR